VLLVIERAEIKRAGHKVKYNTFLHIAVYEKCRKDFLRELKAQ
jgi:hypothetical protein